MAFYPGVFGGELHVNRFSDFPSEGHGPAPEGVMHAMLEKPNGFTLMASDMPPGTELGSAHRMVDGDHSAAERAWRRVEHLHDGDVPHEATREHDRPALAVPVTSIYSRTDGIAAWRTCIDVVGERAENIEVRGSHIGMALNPAVVWAVLDRLAQPEDDWRPFAPPLLLRGCYPRPASWQERATAA